jgi:GWxTD domain-containing protein
MRSSLAIALGMWTALGPTALSAEQSFGGLAVRTVRFYRPQVQQTRIKAFIEIPYAILTPVVGSSSGHLVYKIAVTLADSSGLTLLRQEWWGRGRSELQGLGASALETLDFAVAPGGYRLHVAVLDSISGASKEVSTEVHGFSTPPRISDLWLAPKMRLASADDTVPMPGELREGRTLVTAAARVILTPLRSTTYYLVEAYADTQKVGTMQMMVSDSTGKSLVRTPPTPVTVTAGGGILKGQMDLAGLPAGQYTMTFTLVSGTDTASRSADFLMQGLEETLGRDVVDRAARRVTDQGYFAEMHAAQLDEAEAPLYYIAQSAELAAYDKKLSLAAKRKLLTEFWAKRDPTPGTPRNESRERFYQAIADANRNFTEGGRRPVPGWKSDRGRIYARYGAPDDKLDRQQEGTAPRYQVWRYTRERSRYYVFADRTGFGTFVLMTTNDTKEVGQANWMQILGIDAVEDVGRFLGVNFLVQ